jgi:hypothetical protein
MPRQRLGKPTERETADGSGITGGKGQRKIVLRSKTIAIFTVLASLMPGKILNGTPAR